jgi:hypothetical protein
MEEKAGNNCNAYMCSQFGNEEDGHCISIITDNGIAWSKHPRSGMPIVREPGWTCPFYECRKQTATA